MRKIAFFAFMLLLFFSLVYYNNAKGYLYFSFFIPLGGDVYEDSFD